MGLLKKKSHIQYIRNKSGKVVDVKYTGNIDKNSSLSPKLQMKIKAFEEKEKIRKQILKDAKKKKRQQTLKKINSYLDKVDPNKKQKPKDPMNPTGINWGR